MNRRNTSTVILKTVLTHAEFLKMKEKRLSALGTFNDDNILNKYSSFLKSHEWDFFCTFTTKQALTLSASRRMMENLAKMIGCGGTYNFMNTTIPGKQFQEPINLAGTGRAMLFWASEPFKLRNSFHMHALMKCDLTQQQVIAHWESKYGFSNIKKYNSSKPGAEYVTKYVLKTISDYDLHS